MNSTCFKSGKSQKSIKNDPKIDSKVDNGNFHVILGDIKAPNETKLGIEIINSWLKNLLKL